MRFTMPGIETGTSVISGFYMPNLDLYPTEAIKYLHGDGNYFSKEGLVVKISNKIN